MKLNRHSSLFKEGRIEQSLAEHRAIVQALTQRQPELAAECMSAHFTNGLQAARQAI
jgi:DNA-binding GntR family transcriptional regulator